MLRLMHWWYTAERGLWLGMWLLLACTSVGDTGDASALAASDGATSDVPADPVDRSMFENELATIGPALCARYGQPWVIRKQGCGQIAFDFQNGYTGGGV